MLTAALSLRWPDGNPPPVDGCRWCGDDHRTGGLPLRTHDDHAYFHPYVSPTEAQRAARRAAREAHGIGDCWCDQPGTDPYQCPAIDGLCTSFNYLLGVWLRPLTHPEALSAARAEAGEGQ